MRPKVLGAQAVSLDQLSLTRAVAKFQYQQGALRDPEEAHDQRRSDGHPDHDVHPKGWLNAQLQGNGSDGHQRADDHDEESGWSVTNIKLCEVELARPAVFRKANGAREKTRSAAPWAESPDRRRGSVRGVVSHFCAAGFT